MSDSQPSRSVVYDEFWASFFLRLQGQTEHFGTLSHGSKNWVRVPVGTPKCHLHAAVIARQTKLRVGLTLQRPDGSLWLARLRRDQLEIEREFGEPMIWDDKPDMQRSMVSISSAPFDLSDTDTWRPSFDWAVPRLVRLDTVFRNRLSVLAVSFKGTA